jgi:galactose-1-phosphate uridylyltransferase
MPIIPKPTKEELTVKQYYEYKERCIFYDIMREEMRVGERLCLKPGFFYFSPLSKVS